MNGGEMDWAYIPKTEGRVTNIPFHAEIVSEAWSTEKGDTILAKTTGRAGVEISPLLLMNEVEITGNASLLDQKQGYIYSLDNKVEHTRDTSSVQGRNQMSNNEAFLVLRPNQLESSKKKGR
jgi:hypothetical protein